MIYLLSVIVLPESGLNVFVSLFAIAINDDWYRVQLSDLLDSADQTSSERYYDGQEIINTRGHVHWVTWPSFLCQRWRNLR